LPLLQFDEKNPNDTKREPHEITHAPDAIRYFVAGRPMPAQKPIFGEPSSYNYEDEVQNFLNYGRS
jgi:phage terminase large subunit